MPDLHIIPNPECPDITATGPEPGAIIVLADENVNHQIQVKQAARNCEIAHVFASVYNGQQLMDLLNNRDVYFSKNKLPDLIIMDIDLRLLDGFEILKQIKADVLFRKIPVYVLSHNYTIEGVKRAKSLGAKEFFKKPLTYEELHIIVKGICDLHFKNQKRIIEEPLSES